ncbi:MAG: hypothetical protein MUC97_14645 [Bernardetiaceae bacterium]|jgi:hypothetical protein|nr:hypothetical protein [Bernardetiaceae bacterium]
MKHDDIKKPDELFRPPDGYFDQLPGRIQSRVQAKPASDGFWQVFWLSLKPVYTVPALALGLLLFWAWPAPDPAPASLDDLTAGQVHEYLLDQNLDEETIMEQLAVTGQTLSLQEAGIELPLNPDLVDDLDLEDIEEALQ